MARTMTLAFPALAEVLRTSCSPAVPNALLLMVIPPPVSLRIGFLVKYTGSPCCWALNRPVERSYTCAPKTWREVVLCCTTSVLCTSLRACKCRFHVVSCLFSCLQFDYLDLMLWIERQVPLFNVPCRQRSSLKEVSTDLKMA